MSGHVTLRLVHSMRPHDADMPAPPRCRSECRDGPRPCPWYRCRYHLGTDVSGERIRIREELLEPYVEGLSMRKGSRWRRKQRTPLRLLVRYRDTCALDVADRGEHSSNEVAAMLGLWHTNTEEITAVAMAKFRARLKLTGWAP